MEQPYTKTVNYLPTPLPNNGSIGVFIHYLHKARLLNSARIKDYSFVGVQGGKLIPLDNAGKEHVIKLPEKTELVIGYVFRIESIATFTTRCYKY